MFVKTVYTATRKENLSLALDRESGIYDKSKLASVSGYPDSIYVYPDIQGLRNETLGLLFQAVMFDLIKGISTVILEGLVEESLLQRVELNPMARRIGMRLRVRKIFEIGNVPQPIDITDQWIS